MTTPHNQQDPPEQPEYRSAGPVAVARAKNLLPVLISVILVLIVVGVITGQFNRSTEQDNPDERAQSALDNSLARAEQDLAGHDVQIEGEVKSNSWRGYTVTITVDPNERTAIEDSADFLKGQWSKDPLDPSYFTGWLESDNPPTTYRIDPRVANAWLVELFSQPVPGISHVEVVANNADTGEGTRSDRIEFIVANSWQEAAAQQERITQLIDHYVPVYDAPPIVNFETQSETSPRLSLQRLDGEDVAPALSMMAELVDAAEQDSITTVLVRNTDDLNEVDVKQSDDSEPLDQATEEDIVRHYLPEARIV
ncbi:hypothetical protein [Corynebacterium lubricantis]|uniref:hypothetical protein n=1 Tax=Corynebacterium lubricantis TaxID=541095 RepID=UPI00036E392B|nr:hypothetical protein [Corynebacterium lubricantis]